MRGCARAARRDELRVRDYGGIRRKGKTKEMTEKLSVGDGAAAYRAGGSVLVVLDATEGVLARTQRLRVTRMKAGAR